MNTDLTFITNEKSATLSARFNVLIKGCKSFDVLCGYFYSSGFYKIYKALEETEKIRILVGISTDFSTFQLIEEGKALSHYEVKEKFASDVINEMNEAEDTDEVEEGVKKFIEWIESGKLEIKAYPERRIHAKVYIFTFKEGDRDIGRVITGSSNFTEKGLVDNLEFNVELKNAEDYQFALTKFNELWANATEVSKKYVETVRTKTFINEDITPYELYIKTIYEHFREELSGSEELFLNYLPENFKSLEYQRQAVLNAKRILEEYGGVFISDVVGLGKTYITAMLASQLDGRTLVIAPPALIDRSNPGSWPNVFFDFKVFADFESIGKLDSIIENGADKYQNIIVDEAHRFRVETNISYEKLAEICRGKRVILVTATPYNNSPKDLLSLIKLFQSPRDSSIPGVKNLERFLNSIDEEIKRARRTKDNFIDTVKSNSKKIREEILRHLMIRRTRKEIEKYFNEDLTKQNIKFPEIETPKPLFYELNEEENYAFEESLKILTNELKYARYTPKIYLKEKLTQEEEISQENMAKIMKILLVKRLESSFFAFKNSIDRFIYSYEMFIKEFENGKVYISKKYTQKIFEYIEDEDLEAIQKLIEEGKAEEYDSKDFKDDFITDLKNDFEKLKKIKKLWENIYHDPKLEKLLISLEKDEILSKNKIIIFTESKETADYTTEKINEKFGEIALKFTGTSKESVRDKVIENFDARVNINNKKDGYRILVCTDVLSEGVNLHRSNVVINYDIPWNPTRMMQRVGRINRVDTPFDKIYTFNFFPTTQAENEIKLREIAEAKINAFLSLLGGDSALLTENEPVESHELFNKLLSKDILTGEDEFEESELKYLEIIKNIQEKNPELFEKIKTLPKKARSIKKNNENALHLLTYMREGSLKKFYICSNDSNPVEIDFLSAIKLLESNKNEKQERRIPFPYGLLEKNKNAFHFATQNEENESNISKGKDTIKNILKFLKAMKKDGLTEDDEYYLKIVKDQLESGNLPRKTTKEVLKSLTNLKPTEAINPLNIIRILKRHIPEGLLKDHFGSKKDSKITKKEVILSMYFVGDKNDT